MSEGSGVGLTVGNAGSTMVESGSTPMANFGVKMVTRVVRLMSRRPLCAHAAHRAGVTTGVGELIKG